MKTCSLCLQLKTLEDFSNLKKAKDGKYSWCKICKKMKDNEFYKNNTSKLLNKAHNYYEQNKEKILSKLKSQPEKRRDYYFKNRDKKIAATKNWKQNNKEQVRKNKREYSRKNPGQKQRYLNKYPIQKAVESIRKRIWPFLNNKDKSFAEYIGCSVDELKLHIESQFSVGMSWENKGKWSIDHIFPISAAKTDAEFFSLSHYTNLQPMWNKENSSKNNKITLCWQKVIRNKTEVEDKANGFNFSTNIQDYIFNVEKLSKEHIFFIKKYEWLGNIGAGVSHVFTSRHNGMLGGVVMMSAPNKSQFGEQEILIQRGACASWTPKNLGSKLVMFACNWMVKNTNKRIFTAYSDPEAGEIGTIYQACNFDYLGQNFGAKTMFLTNNQKEVNRRYFTRKNYIKKIALSNGFDYENSWTYATIPEELKNIIKKYMATSRVRVPQKKHKYVLLINYGKNKIKKTWVSKPYPKRNLKE